VYTNEASISIDNDQTNPHQHHQGWVQPKHLLVWTTRTHTQLRLKQSWEQKKLSVPIFRQVGHCKLPASFSQSSPLHLRLAGAMAMSAENEIERLTNLAWKREKDENEKEKEVVWSLLLYCYDIYPPWSVGNHRFIFIVRSASRTFPPPSSGLSRCWMHIHIYPAIN
jgi:hypothetical protein